MQKMRKIHFDIRFREDLFRGRDLVSRFFNPDHNASSENPVAAW